MPTFMDLFAIGMAINAGMTFRSEFAKSFRASWRRHWSPWRFAATATGFLCLFAAYGAQVTLAIIGLIRP